MNNCGTLYSLQYSTVDIMAFQDCFICCSTWWSLVSLSQQLDGNVSGFALNLPATGTCGIGMWYGIKYLCSFYVMTVWAPSFIPPSLSFLSLSLSLSLSLYLSFPPSLPPHRAGAEAVMRLLPRVLWRVSTPSPLANWSPSVSRTSLTALVSTTVRGRG